MACFSLAQLFNGCLIEELFLGTLFINYMSRQSCIRPQRQIAITTAITDSIFIPGYQNRCTYMYKSFFLFFLKSCYKIVYTSIVVYILKVIVPVIKARYVKILRIFFNKILFINSVKFSFEIKFLVLVSKWNSQNTKLKVNSAKYLRTNFFVLFVVRLNLSARTFNLKIETYKQVCNVQLCVEINARQLVQSILCRFQDVEVR